MTREQWRTKCRRQPRRGSESFRGSHAVDSVGVERRASPPPRCGAMLTFRPSLPDQKTQETGKRPNGAADAILAVRLPRSPRHDYYKGIARLGAAAVGTSYAIVRASFSPNHPRRVQNSLEWSFQADFGPRFWFFSSLFGVLKISYRLWVTSI
jgi:hypothetical protein